MKSIIKILFFIMLLAIITIIAGLFLPKQHKIVQTKEISVPQQIVFNQISDFQNWKAWSPWVDLDTNMVINYSDNTKGQLAEISWSSKEFGKCKLIITHAVPPESVAIDFDFGTQSKTTCLWYAEPTINGCKLSWTMNLTKLSLLERYFAFLQKNKIESIITLGLDHLEQRCVDLKYSRTGSITAIDIPAIPTVVLIDTVHPEKIQAKLKDDDAYLLRFFERRDLQPIGKAFKFIYGEVNDTLEKYGYGYPLEKRTWVWRTLNYIQIPEGKALMASHFGRQKNTFNAHSKIRAYMKLNNLELDGTPWEIYLFNPETDIDTSLWETQIYFPVK